MANRLQDEIRRSQLPIDRMASIQGEEILRSYKHGKYYFDELTGLYWMIERESPTDFLARLFQVGSDDVMVVERKQGRVRSYKHGQDQVHPLQLGSDSSAYKLLESKLRYPQLLTQPDLWKKLA